MTILHRTSMWHMGVTHTRSTLYDTAHPPPRVHRAVRRETRAPATTPVHRAPPPAHRGDPDRGSRSIDSPWTPCVQYVLYSVSQSVSQLVSHIYYKNKPVFAIPCSMRASHAHTRRRSLRALSARRASGRDERRARAAPGRAGVGVRECACGRPTKTKSPPSGCQLGHTAAPPHLVAVRCEGEQQQEPRQLAGL